MNDVTPLQIRTPAEISRGSRSEEILYITWNGGGEIEFARLHLLHVIGDDTIGVGAKNDMLHIVQVAQSNVMVSSLVAGVAVDDTLAEGSKEAILDQATTDEARGGISLSSTSDELNKPGSNFEKEREL